MTPQERDALLARALEYAGGTHTVADVNAAIARGEFQLWQGQRSLVVTQVSEHPQCKEAFAFAAAGEMGEIQALYPIVMAWAKAIGCTKVAFRGRKGWGRSFLTKTEGWHEAAVIYERTI